MSTDPNGPGSALMHYLDDDGNIVFTIRVPEIVVQYHNIPYPVEFCHYIRDLTYEPLEQNRQFINDYLSSILAEFGEFKFKNLSEKIDLFIVQKTVQDINKYTEKIQNFIKEINEIEEVPMQNETLTESLLVRNIQQVLFIIMKKIFKDL